MSVRFRDLGVAMRIRHFGGIETASTHDELGSILRFNDPINFCEESKNKEGIILRIAVMIQGEIEWRKKRFCLTCTE